MASSAESLLALRSLSGPMRTRQMIGFLTGNAGALRLLAGSMRTCSGGPSRGGPGSCNPLAGSMRTVTAHVAAGVQAYELRPLAESMRAPLPECPSQGAMRTTKADAVRPTRSPAPPWPPCYDPSQGL